MGRPARHFVVLVVITAVVVALLMWPRRNEQFSIMRDRAEQAQIIRLLEPRLARDGDNADLLAMLGRSYADIGDNHRAAELFERYLMIRPDDGDAYAQLADIYGNTGDQARRIALLRRSLALQPTLDRAMELAGLYRDRQQADEELAVLSQYEPQLTLESGLLLRLAKLYVAHGNREQALHVLMRPEVLAAPKPPLGGQDERLYLADLLVEEGRSAEAVSLGKQWILQWREPWLAGRLVSNVALRAPTTEASQLAGAVVELHPNLHLYLASNLAKTGAAPVALHLLAAWSQANSSPSADELAAFLSACRDQNQLAIVWTAFAEAIWRRAPEDVISRYSDAIAAEFGIESLAPFWQHLPPSVYRTKSLLAARLAFQEHDLELTRRLLQGFDLRTATKPESAMWLGLLSAVAPPADVFATLRDRRSSGSLPRDLLTKYAVMAGELGLESEYQATLTELHHRE